MLSMESPDTYHDLELRPCIVSVDDNITNSEAKSQNPLLGLFRLNILALTLGGLQGVFCFEFSLGSLHLLSLGVTKPIIALIWLSGPLAGVLVQPYFGIWSDNYSSKWGRRKPFIVGGAVVVILSLLGFAWAKNIVETCVLIFFGRFGVEENILKALLAITAAFFICSLNVAIQAIQCGARALIVDKASPHEQDQANACASLMIAIGSVVSYANSSFDISGNIFSWNVAQVKVISVLTSIILAVSVWITSTSIKEENATCSLQTKDIVLGSSFVKMKQIFYATRNLSPLSKQVYRVQFCSWTGWFLFLTYNTMYTKEISQTEVYDFSEGDLMNKIVIMGSRGLLIFAVSSLVSSFTFLLIFRYLFPTRMRSNKHELLACGRPLGLSKHTLIMNIWTISHGIFAACMFATYFLSNTASIYTMMACAGFTWAVTTWAPFTLISMNVSTMDSTFSRENGAGIMIGLLNVSICLPQILAAFVSEFVFWWLGNENSSTSIVCLLNFGGVAAALAACLCGGVRFGADH